MSDTNFISICDQPSVGTRFLGEIVPPDGTSDALKFSNAQHGTVIAKRILGGKEDCVDFNRGCACIHVQVDEWCPRGKYVATIKGGARDIVLSGTLKGHGTETDIDLGNWSDQSNARTTKVVLNLRTEDGSPIQVRVLNADRPFILNPEQNYEIETRWSRWFLPIFSLLKALKIA